MANPKYDKETLMQMRIIEIEEKQKKLERRLEDCYSSVVGDEGVLLDFRKRIKTLEEARERQKLLNHGYSKISPKRSFWDKIRNK